jgi:hypothetical protein
MPNRSQRGRSKPTSGPTAVECPLYETRMFNVVLVAWMLGKRLRHTRSLTMYCSTS